MIIFGIIGFIICFILGYLAKKYNWIGKIIEKIKKK
jgi:hypothetical protein